MCLQWFFRWVSYIYIVWSEGLGKYTSVHFWTNYCYLVGAGGQPKMSQRLASPEHWKCYLVLKCLLQSGNNIMNIRKIWSWVYIYILQCPMDMDFSVEGQMFYKYEEILKSILTFKMHEKKPQILNTDCF